MEDFWAGIWTALIIWCVFPFGLYFFLGMGNRTDKEKKIFAIAVLVFGVATLMMAANDLYYNTSAEDKKEALVFGLLGILCFAESFVIFSILRKRHTKQIEEQIAELKSKLERFGEVEQHNQTGLWNKIHQLAETTNDFVQLYRKSEVQRMKDSEVRDFYRSYLDEMILKSPKNYFKQPSSRIVRICNDWNGISVSKEKDPEFYKLIDDFFRIFLIRGRKLYERESEKEILCKKLLDFFKNVEYDEDEEREARAKFYDHLDLCEKECIVQNVDLFHDAFVFTEKYYIMSVDWFGEINQSVLNSNFIFHDEIRSESKVMCDLYGFDYSKIDENLGNDGPNRKGPILRELFIIPSTEIDPDYIYFIRKDLDGDYLFWRISTGPYCNQEINDLYKLSQEFKKF